MTGSRAPNCPLCGSRAVTSFHRDAARDYLRCGTCALVFVPPHQHLSPAAEKAQYDLHRNHPDDPGYRRFLGRLFEPLAVRLAPGSRGLDFGSGPGPTLSLMFAEAGHEVANFDPFYAPEPSLLARRYDFITLSEVAEHLARPGDELDRLWQILNPGGWLGVMTKRLTDPDAFAGWHYRRDPTHVCFFSEASFNWLGDHWRAAAGQTVEAEITGPDTVLFRKPVAHA